MLSPVLALPLLLATALSASSEAPARPPADVSAAAPIADFRSDPVPTLESSPRTPEPALRRVWSAVGCQVVQTGAPAPLRGRVASEAARAIQDHRVLRIRTRGPPRRVS
jgi:hypothetical protein